MGTQNLDSSTTESPHVLAIDNEVAIHGVLERLLPREGIAVTTCTCGEDALEKLEEGTFDLVLSDVQMPGMGGLELLDHISEHSLSVSVVLLSTQDNVQQAVRAMQKGAVDYIPKPFSTDELVERIKTILEKEPAEDQGGPSKNAPSTNGSSKSASSTNAPSTNGTADTAARTAGSPASNGAASNGAGSNGSANGTPVNGAAANGTGVNGTAAHGASLPENGTSENGASDTSAQDPGALEAGGIKFVGEHQCVRELRKMVGRIASSRAPVFVQGESGTGKEILSRLIHEKSDRAGEAYVPVNCAALPSELVESHLFGHVEGAFTGAVDDMVGAFEKADGGTLLLDEISEISPSVQAKLLRVLQTQEFQKVGSSDKKSVDVRVIATSNRDLEEAVEEGTFREDLYHRLAVFPLQVPPLRGRLSDIPLLAEHFIEKYTGQYDLPPKTLSPGLLQRFQSYSWPGNVRELENMIHRGVVMAGARDCIEEGDVIDYFFAGDEAGEVPGSDQSGNGLSGDVLANITEEGSIPTIEEMERKLILSTLSKEEVSQKEAAEALGISARTIRNKLQKYREQGFSI